MNWKGLIDILSAALTPVIAIVTVYIAIQQHRIERLQFRFQLYERRLVVYKTTMQLLAAIISHGNITFEKLSSHMREFGEARFLFDKDISDHIDELFKKSLRLEYVNKRLDSSGLSDKEERSRLDDERSELFSWFQGQVEAMHQKFSKDLSLK